MTKQKRKDCEERKELFCNALLEFAEDLKVDDLASLFCADVDEAANRELDAESIKEFYQLTGYVWGRADALGVEPTELLSEYDEDESTIAAIDSDEDEEDLDARCRK